MEWAGRRRSRTSVDHRKLKILENAHAHSDVEAEEEKTTEEREWKEEEKEKGDMKERGREMWELCPRLLGILETTRTSP